MVKSLAYGKVIINILYKAIQPKQVYNKFYVK